MSNGSGPIIINSLIAAPGVTDEEKKRLEKLEKIALKEHRLPKASDRNFVCSIVRRLLS